MSHTIILTNAHASIDTHLVFQKADHPSVTELAPYGWRVGATYTKITIHGEINATTLFRVRYPKGEDVS